MVVLVVVTVVVRISGGSSSSHSSSIVYIASLYRYTFMNTDMNQYLIFRYASTVVRKMTAYQLCSAWIARSPFVLTEHISSFMEKIKTFKNAKKI